jgi:hypothetical protein
MSKEVKQYVLDSVLGWCERGSTKPVDFDHGDRHPAFVLAADHAARIAELERELAQTKEAGLVLVRELDRFQDEGNAQIIQLQTELARAREWINQHAKHDERDGRCYGLVRGRYVGDPPDMVYEEHKCRCGLDALKAALAPTAETGKAE